ncbi:MAG TPA: NAD(P)H-dependent oxidoreductase subunit E [Candidatus Micrarchaeia archaeon]|nr:NAD(P)H-dependent oxidoreductase subunit E [Candidatus Micrarchaeia archaeon]
MDLRSEPGRATAEERAAVDAVLGAPDGLWDGGARAPDDARLALGGHAARDRRQRLLPALHALQDGVGWLSPGGLAYVSARLTVPPAEAFGVASFYALFSTAPRPATVLHVCDDIVCRGQGAEAVCQALTERFGPALGEPRPGAPGADDPAWDRGRVPATGWVRSPCLGRCEQGSAALVQRTVGAGAQPRATSLAPAPLAALLEVLGGGAPPVPAGRPPAPQAARAPRDPGLRLLRRVGLVDPASLDSYRAHGGTKALRSALALGPSGVIRELEAARLLGRGGAAFPTAAKWQAVAANPARPHLVVCNADESEPGTFKDRVVMELDPFAVVEALTVMGFACGAGAGYLYVRGEYPEAEARLRAAIVDCRRRGLLGDRVLGTDFAFDIECRRGAGAYIAGEETALFRSIEGGRAEPRNKPPFPSDVGLFGRPTAVNNVETLLCVLEALTVGGPAFAAIGTEGSTGTRLFCVAGAVERPGLYEFAFGATLRQVLDAAGGVRGGRALRAALLGGVAGSFVGADALDVPLTFEGVRAIGASLGSGVVVAVDDTVDVMDQVLRIARFFRDESCGQCVPCRVGTVRQEEALARLAAARPLGSAAAEQGRLDDLAQAMRDASICGLGQTAAIAVQSAIRLGLIGPGREAAP